MKYIINTQQWSDGSIHFMGRLNIEQKTLDWLRYLIFFHKCLFFRCAHTLFRLWIFFFFSFSILQCKYTRCWLLFFFLFIYWLTCHAKYIDCIFNFLILITITWQLFFLLEKRKFFFQRISIDRNKFLRMSMPVISMIVFYNNRNPS